MDDGRRDNLLGCTKDLIAQARHRARQRFGQARILTCPICGTDVTALDLGHGYAGGAQVRIYMPLGISIVDLRMDLSTVNEKDVMRFRCGEGHRWKMSGTRIDGVTCWDRWDTVTDAD